MIVYTNIDKHKYKPAAIDELFLCRQFCEEKGIPYTHFPTVWENWVSSATHLFQMGRDESPKNMKLDNK